MAFAQIQIRNLTATERTGAIVVYFSLGSALFALTTLPFGWVWPGPWEAFLLALCGLFGGLGQIFLTQGMRHADASVIAPLEYASMLWAVISGFWVFGEVPGVWVAIGAGVIIASGIVVVVSERRGDAATPVE
jgi:drug/metabolite transporter (DMT)-like permease